MSNTAKPAKPWQKWTAAAALAGLAALAVAALAAGNLNSQAVTDTTAPASDAVSGANYIKVTDTTLAPPPEPASALAAGQAEPTTTTTTTVPFVVVTRPPAPPRVSHPTWDSRLPSTWDGITATECNNTLRYPVIDDPPAWDYWYNIHGGHFVLPEESWVIAEALKNPSFEPASGTVEHTAITNLGLTSAQDIRGIGEGAADVRWYALSIKNTIINREGDLEHPSCASILAGANAVLNAPYTTTTTRAGS